MVAVEPVHRERFERAPGDVGAGGIEHRVVVRERHVREISQLLSTSKAAHPPSFDCIASSQSMAR